MFSTVILKPPKPRQKVDACKFCGFKVVWRETMAGKFVPIDLDHHVAQLDLGYEEIDSRFIHFNTCVHKDKFRANQPKPY